MTKSLETIFNHNCFEEVHADDLPGDLALIAREIGVPAAVKLAIAYPSCSFWIPRNGVDKLFRQLIISEYKQGIPARDIAIRINRSMRFVQKIIRELNENQK